MMIQKHVLILAACSFVAGAATPAVSPFFHLMQIEQVIGGVNGDVTAQAIQLRMRGNFECFITATKVWVRDAAGQNPVLLIEFTTDVPGCSVGDRILITSSKFTSLLDNAIDPDFMLTNLIPESYLAAGSMTFEDNSGTFVYWRLSWGGKNYTGDTSGETDNDADGEFGPPYDGPLPADSLQALQFQGPANAPSTNNQDDYALTKGASTWTNNAGDNGTLEEPSSCPWDLDGNTDVGIGDLLILLGAWGPNPGHPADFDGNDEVGVSDLLLMLANWGPCPPPPSTAFPISIEPPPADQLSIGVAFDGTNFLVGIQGDNLYGEGGKAQITAQLVSQTGTLVGPLIEVERTGGLPSVAFDGNNYLLVWVDDLKVPGDEVYGQFIGSSGALIGTPFLIATTNEENGPPNLISIAFGETGFLVTYYREIDPKTPDDKLYGRIVGTDGSVGEELSISTDLADHVAPNVAWDGTNFLAIWVDDDNDTVVRGRFVSPTGNLGLEFIINASPDPSDNPATVAFDGTNFLVVWSDEVGGKGSGQWDLLGHLVSTAGTLMGGVIPISTVPGQQFLPFIAFDGANYLVTWTDFRNDANGDFVCDLDEGTCADIYGQYISSSGSLVGSEFAISTEPDSQLGSAVVFADGKYLVVYNNSPDFETGLGVFGVFITP